MRSLPFVIVPAAMCLLVACGSNNAGVPPELLAAIKSQGSAANYPAGPYGTQVGDVVQDLCFDGWTDPKAENYDPTRFTKICLGDFQGPTTKLLLVESCAIWCVNCRTEYEGSANRPSLSAQLASLQGEGFRILGTLFENAAQTPAAPSDAVAWAQTFSIDFPFTLDPQDQMSLFRSATVAPFNMLIDTTTMKIVLALDGDEPGTLFGTVDQFLQGKTSK